MLLLSENHGNHFMDISVIAMSFTHKGGTMDSRTYYYARVSSKEQNLDRQIAAFNALGAQEREIIADKESGKDLERAGYQALKNAMLRKGDTLVVKSLDRLSRNKRDIKNELQYFKENGIRLKVIDLPTTMMDLPEGQEWVFEMVNNILIEVLGTIAEQERETIRKRQAEGIKAAKQKGKKLGRPALTFPANWAEVYATWKGGEITAKAAMEQTGTKRTSFYKLVGRSEKEGLTMR
ncbi:resolvase, N-terminal domain protein [Pseudoflavonifractor capillosus ATCC 29799]|uniref:Resolvase, N-terminal domain protein n=2 Tax=Pseudoflavonifractor capillosus TaxID=106588 RepID=A6NSA5_9FIRM|nr:resolvase, N-terminal domain protein [Pseudoflavonifractor capillosus ATCC 29799]